MFFCFVLVVGGVEFINRVYCYVMEVVELAMELLDAFKGVNITQADSSDDDECAVKAVIKDPQSVEALLTQVTQSQNPAVRTVAAVQLRKSIAKHWADLPPEARRDVADEWLCDLPRARHDIDAAMPRIGGEHHQNEAEVYPDQEDTEVLGQLP